jgi:hypothetical protein
MERLSTKLSTLWLFASLNYLYCDVVTLMDPALLRGDGVAVARAATERQPLGEHRGRRIHDDRAGSLAVREDARALLPVLQRLRDRSHPDHRLARLAPRAGRAGGG